MSEERLASQRIRSLRSLDEIDSRSSASLEATKNGGMRGPENRSS